MSTDNGDILAETFGPVEASKFDSGKLRWSLLPWDAAGEVVRVLMFGAKKYGASNWVKGMDWTRMTDAATRHMTAWLAGEDRDPESGIHHLAHACCCLLFAVAYGRRGIGKDDRHVG